MNVRSSYNRFPEFTQFFWTWLTGKPNDDEQPLFVTNCWIYLATSMLVFSVGVSISMTVMLIESGYWWLLISIPITLQGARLLVLTIAHQCAHNMFCQDKPLNEVVHDIVSTLMMSQDYVNYRHDHLAMHHGIKTFGSFHDPVLDFIRSNGLTEGLSRRQLWLRMWLMFLSPLFHARYLLNRLRSNFMSAAPHRILMSFVWWGGVSILLILKPNLAGPILVAYVVPITLPYHVSAFLELMCEHIWMRPVEMDRSATGRNKISELSWGRFCGDQVPSGYNFIQWSVWIGRLLFYHLPSRMLVLTGDAPQHDYHHVNPRSRRWTVSAYDRRDAVLSGKCNHLEVWGLFTAIDQVFQFIARCNKTNDFPNDLNYLRKET